MKTKILTATLLAATTGAAQAQLFMVQNKQAALNHVDGYYIAHHNFDAEGVLDEDGDGFGFKGSAQLADQFFATAEYQQTETDDFDLELEQIRAGAGFLAPASRELSFTARAEWIRTSVDVPGFSSDEENGVGLHGGVSFQPAQIPELVLYASIGYVNLDDVDGPEYNVGARFLFSPQISLFVDWRGTRLEDDGDDLDLDDVRVGLGFHF